MTHTLTEAMETRAVDFELEPSRNGRNLRGYAAVFNSRTRIPDRNGDFDEELKPGFADRSLREHGYPIMQWDHGRDNRVGTVPIGVWTEWKPDGKGYQVRGHLIDDPVIEPVRKAIAEGAVTGLSFRFKVTKNGDRWERRHGGVDLRHVIDADVHEAGPVVFPAYRDAKVSIRDLNGLSVVERHFDDEDDVEERTVEAYALTWHGLTEQRGLDGQPVRVRIGRHALDDWLAVWREDGCPPLPILREHGRDGHTRAVGHLVDAWADDYGLRTAAVYHDSAEGRAALDDIAAGVLKGYSQHLQVLESRDVGGVVEVTSAVQVECGPTVTPFDRGARIVEAGGVPVETRAGFDGIEDLVEFCRIQTGRSTEDLLAVGQAQEREFVRSVTESVRVADALARAVAERRSAAAERYFEWSRFHRGADFNEALAADRDERELMAELREVLHNDRSLVRQVLASAGAPDYRSPFRSTRATLAAAGVNR